MYAASFSESSMSTSPSLPCPHASLISHYLWKPYQSFKTNPSRPISSLPSEIWFYNLQAFLSLSLDLKHSFVTLGLQDTGTFNTRGPFPASKRKKKIWCRVTGIPYFLWPSEKWSSCPLLILSIELCLHSAATLFILKWEQTIYPAFSTANELKVNSFTFLKQPHMP